MTRFDPITSDVHATRETADHKQTAEGLGGAFMSHNSIVGAA